MVTTTGTGAGTVESYHRRVVGTPPNLDARSLHERHAPAQVVRVLQEIYGDAASDIKSAPTTGHMGPGGQLSEAVLRDYHFYGHAAAWRLAIARSLAEAISRR